MLLCQFPAKFESGADLDLRLQVVDVAVCYEATEFSSRFSGINGPFCLLV